MCCLSVTRPRPEEPDRGRGDRGRGRWMHADLDLAENTIVPMAGVFYAIHTCSLGSSIPANKFNLPLSAPVAPRPFSSRWMNRPLE